MRVGEGKDEEDASLTPFHPSAFTEPCPSLALPTLARPLHALCLRMLLVLGGEGDLDARGWCSRLVHCKDKTPYYNYHFYLCPISKDAGI